MTVNVLASLIAMAEGRKHQASIGDIREILKIIINGEVESLLKPDCGSPIATLRLAALELATRKLFFGGGSCEKRRKAKVSKEDKISRRGDRKAKKASRRPGRKNANKKD